MKFNITIIALAILANSLTAAAQRVPSFAAYRSRVEKIRNVTVDLRSHKRARMYRTNLRNAATGGVNFAGHFILTGWGCGTNCSQWAIIDARNGRVFFPDELDGVGMGFCELPKGKLSADTPELDDHSDGPVYFKPNSRLLVLQGFTGGGLDDEKAKCGNYFFEWTGTRLRRVGFIAGKRTGTP